MRAETILIVDDDPISLTVARLVLSQAGYLTETAADGLEALAALQRAVPDLIVSDIQMPNMDGYEFARRVREIPRFHATPLIALTAFATKESEQMAYDAGFSAYMTKPVTAAALAAGVRRHLAACA